MDRVGRVRYRPLGSSGLVVSVVGVGGNNFGRTVDAAGTRAIVDAAIEAGITLFDTADVYGNRGGSEELLGAALEGRRDEIVIATKWGSPMGGPEWEARGSRGYIRRAVEASLRRLRTDWIDLYQYHVPDEITPIEETLEALDELVAEGLVRYVGSSNMAAWEVADAEWTARDRGLARFVSAQNSYSLVERDVEAELVPACDRYGIGILPYFPLASGLLTGKYARGEEAKEGRLAGRDIPDERWDAVEALQRFADERGRTLLEVAIGGLAAQPAVGSVIAGATSPQQVRANAAAGEWEPSADDLAALDEAAPPAQFER
jgi:aryl-alcohol dehydrogenase-like predicted oxidoreductase